MNVSCQEMTTLSRPLATDSPSTKPSHCATQSAERTTPKRCSDSSHSSQSQSWFWWWPRVHIFIFHIFSYINSTKPSHCATQSGWENHAQACVQPGYLKKIHICRYRYRQRYTQHHTNSSLLSWREKKLNALCFWQSLSRVYLNLTNASYLMAFRDDEVQ